MTLAPDDPRHGTVNGYGNLKCRCQPCRDAWAAKLRERVAMRKARAEGMAPMHVLAVVPEHGTESRYGNHGCRCGLCRKAWAAQARRQRRNRLARSVGSTTPPSGKSAQRTSGRAAGVVAGPAAPTNHGGAK